jgi:hypothetical protein
VGTGFLVAARRVPGGEHRETPGRQGLVRTGR